MKYLYAKLQKNQIDMPLNKKDVKNIWCEKVLQAAVRIGRGPSYEDLAKVLKRQPKLVVRKLP
jgi:hypothetical protein